MPRTISIGCQDFETIRRSHQIELYSRYLYIIMKLKVIGLWLKGTGI